MKGVTQRVYDEYRRSIGVPVAPVRNISNSEFEAIYRKKYWNEIKDKLASGASKPKILLACMGSPSNGGDVIYHGLENHPYNGFVTGLDRRDHSIIDLFVVL
jgi:hypothetical protein